MGNWLLLIVGVIFLVSVVIGYFRGFLRIGVSLLSSILIIVIVINLSPYIASAISDYTSLDDRIEERIIGALTSEDSADAQADHSREEQIQSIEDSSLPNFLKDMLISNNNGIIYDELGVSGFLSYMAAYLTRLVIRILSFLVTFILAFILVRILMATLDIIGNLPVLGTLNHLGGAAVGALAALLIVWIGFLVLTVFYSTETGEMVFEMIDNSKILTFLFDHNILLNNLISF